MDVIKQAEILVKGIQESEEFKNLKKATDEVMEEKDKEAEQMLSQLKKYQLEIQSATSIGKVVSEEILSESQELFHKCILKPSLAKYLQAEFKFMQMFQKIQKILAEGLAK